MIFSENFADFWGQFKSTQARTDLVNYVGLAVIGLIFLAVSLAWFGGV